MAPGTSLVVALAALAAALACAPGAEAYFSFAAGKSAALRRLLRDDSTRRGELAMSMARAAAGVGAARDAATAAAAAAPALPPAPIPPLPPPREQLRLSRSAPNFPGQMGIFKQWDPERDPEPLPSSSLLPRSVLTTGSFQGGGVGEDAQEGQEGDAARLPAPRLTTLDTLANSDDFDRSDRDVNPPGTYAEQLRQILITTGY